jgi:LPXTG-site transpeptidase (sortase) family protein
MRFVHQKGLEGAKKRRPLRLASMVIGVAGLVAGLYLLLLVLTPNIPILYPVEKIDAKSLPEPQEDSVYIPKIGVNIPFNAGDESVLDNGAWHRFPERGDPMEGGNFILSAHRFEIGWTPGATRRKSPFYNVGKLEVGDQILVDFSGERYGYEITEKSSVKPNQVEIEDETEDARLTLYTCTLKGETDGREVFYAKPLGKVVNGAVDRANVES